MYGVKKYSNFILLYVAVQFSQHHLSKRQSFLHSIFFFLMYFIFGCTKSSLLPEAFSSRSEQGLLSSCRVQASHCSDFSCCRP